MTQKSRVGRITLYLVLLSLVLASIIGTVYSKYIGTYKGAKFDIYVTAGTLNVEMSGGSSGKLIPGTYVDVVDEPIVKIAKNSEESYLFLTVSKTEDLKDLIDIYTNNARCNAEEGYTDGVWLTLANDPDEDFVILYRRVTKAELIERSGSGDYAEYPVLRKVTAVTPGSMWVKPETATMANLAKIDETDNITFTAYAVQVTLGIDDPVTAWNKLPGVHKLASDLKPADANCDQDGNVQYLYGAGTDVDPYTISDKAELKYFAENATKDDYAGDYFKLTDSIKWSSFNGDTANPPSSGSNWTPIGKDKTDVFVGKFDGNGQTISGIYCYGTTGLGLFNYAAGEIKNLTIDSSAFIATGNKVAPFVANMSDNPDEDLIVENCKNYATVQGSQYVSGIVSFINLSGQELTVKNCINYGNISIPEGKYGHVSGILARAGEGATLVEGCTNYGTITGGEEKGSDNAGGIVGRAIGGTAKITRCDNFGLILGDSLIGGIAGNVFDGTTIEYCYNAGAVVSVSSVKAAGVGGIVGRAQTGTTISNCIHAGEVRITYTKSQRWGEIVGDCGLKLKPEFENQNQNQNQNQTEDENQQVNEDMYDALFLNSTDGVTISNCYFVPSANAGGYAASKNDVYAESMDWAESYASLEELAEAMSGGTLSLDKWSATNENGNYTLKTPAGNLVTVTTPKYFVGEGTKTSPFLISVPDDLTFLANHHTDAQYSGKHFKLTNDIVVDANAKEFFSGYTYTKLSGSELQWSQNNNNWTNELSIIKSEKKIDIVPNWTPIGTPTNPFVGTFDGNGKTVSGIYCSVDGNATIDGGSGMSAGFFGAVNGTVKNLTVKDSFFNGEYMVGGIVGHVGNNADLAIENCVNKATVAGVAGVGGIFGGYPGDKDQAGRAGGVGVPLTGRVNIKGCVNYGAIYGFDKEAGNSSVGGIAGSFRIMGESSITYCVNEGSVTSLGGCVGGIVGQAMYCKFTMTYCINEGSIEGYRLVGGITGKLWQHETNTKVVKNLINTGNVTATSTSHSQVGLINGNKTDEQNYKEAFNDGTYYYLSTSKLINKCTTNPATGLSGQMINTEVQEDLNLLNDLIAKITDQIPALQEPPTDGNS